MIRNHRCVMNWSLIENDKISKTVTLNKGKVISIEENGVQKINIRGLMFDLGRGKQSTFSDQNFIDAGWLIHDYDQPGEYQYQGDFIIEENRINREIIDKTPEEIDIDNLNEWRSEMAVLDSQVTPRMIEDICDFITGVTTELPSQIGDLMSARKSKRAERSSQTT